MSIQLTPSPNNYKGTEADRLASSRVYQSYDILQVTDKPGQFYFGAQSGEPFSGLLPFQTALKYHNPVAANATATLTAAQVKAGVITSTSAAATSLTLPTGALLGSALKAARGLWFEFAVDNSVGGNIVTVVASAGIVAATAVITGSATLTVGVGAVGLFKIYFLTATTAVIYRIG